MGIVNNISASVATLGPVGYLPAPGTWGTVCAVPFMYALRSIYSLPVALAIVACITLIACLAVHYALPQFDGNDDPSQIVIDEFVGFSVLACGLPVNPILFCAGFFLFRFFDIVKPLGIKSIEHFYGVIGIMGDDLVAALYAAICIWGMFYVL